MKVHENNSEVLKSRISQITPGTVFKENELYCIKTDHGATYLDTGTDIEAQYFCGEYEIFPDAFVTLK